MNTSSEGNNRQIQRWFRNRFKEDIEVEIDPDYLGGLAQQVSIFQVAAGQRNFIWSVQYPNGTDLSTFILLEIASLDKPAFSGYSGKAKAFYYYGSRDAIRSLEKDRLEYYVLQEVTES